MLLPPDLLYLVIYNPTLKPVDNDLKGVDEDAEEQAHILFYTAKQRAVSRDKMLRQVGLAKALVNFSSISGADHVCESVHSQARRMLMLSPEPNFWIHACIELGKTPRPPAVTHDKGKAKAKPNNDVSLPEKVLYDYHECSLHDSALKAQLMAGYQTFKLTHGSFTTILNTLGKTALELQLERFFTVWSWTWDLEPRADFAATLGPSIHPFSSQLLPHIATFSSSLPSDLTPLFLDPPYLIANKHTMLSHNPYSSALPLYLLSKFPAPQSVTSQSLNNDSSSVTLIPAINTAKVTTTHAKKNSLELFKDTFNNSGLLSISPMNPKIDIRKWNWQGVLTFGLSSNHEKEKEDTDATAVANQPNPKPEVDESQTENTDNSTQNAKDTMVVPSKGNLSEEDSALLKENDRDIKVTSGVREQEQKPTIEVSVDESALEEALASHNLLELKNERSTENNDTVSDISALKIDRTTSTSLSLIPNAADNLTPNKPEFVGGESQSNDGSCTSKFLLSSSLIHGQDVEITAHSPTESDQDVPVSSNDSPAPQSEPLVLPQPVFSQLYVHQETGNCIETRKVKILYMKHESVLCALIPTSSSSSTDSSPLGSTQTATSPHENPEIDNLARSTQTFLTKLYEILSSLKAKSNSETISFQGVSSLLQRSQTIVSISSSTSQQYSYGASTFTSTSEHLYEQRGLLHKYPDTKEIFSRGQNPQNWYISKRILSPTPAHPVLSTRSSSTSTVKAESSEESSVSQFRTDNEDFISLSQSTFPSRAGQASCDKVQSNTLYTIHMESGRKEASLPDVDAEITSATRKFMTSD